MNGQPLEGELLSDLEFRREIAMKRLRNPRHRILILVNGEVPKAEKPKPGVDASDVVEWARFMNYLLWRQR